MKTAITIILLSFVRPGNHHVRIIRESEFGIYDTTVDTLKHWHYAGNKLWMVDEKSEWCETVNKTRIEVIE